MNITNELFSAMTKDNMIKIDDFTQFLQHITIIMPLINRLPNMTFFIKDNLGRYQLVNSNLIKRSRAKSIEDVMGLKAKDVFDGIYGQRHSALDERVFKNKLKVVNYLELHFYQSGMAGWCFTTKIPLINKYKEVVGLIGASVDIQEDDSVRIEVNEKLSRVQQYIDQHIDETLSVVQLAEIAGWSVSQLGRQFLKVFNMTPQQLIAKKRFENALELLQKNLPITEIAHQCGYSDHSAFSRKFKELTGLTPTKFRKSLRT